MRNRDNIVNELEEVHQKMLAYMQAHCRLFLFEGIFLIFLGFCAIAIPQFFSVAIIIVLGWIIVFGGVIQVSRIIFFPQIPGFGLWFVSGVLQIVVGYLLIADPIVGVLTLTMMMTLFFALEGIIKIYLALMLRPLPHWNFLFFSGVTALVFALFIVVFWSETAHWLLGLFLGINMMMLGWTMVKMGLRYKQLY